MRLIDADTLSEKLCETTLFIKDGEVFQRMINDAPTIDAVQVVRCKDCKNYDGGEVEHEYDRCRHHWSAVEPNDWCSFGERRQNDA